MALSRYVFVMENLLLGMEMFNFKCWNPLIFDSITLQRTKFVLTFNLNVIHSSKHLTRLKLTFLMTVKDFEHFIHVLRRMFFRFKDGKYNISNIIFVCNCHRCTVIFKFFWGGTWGCEKIWEGVLYFRVLLQFLCYNFSKSLEGVHEVPPSFPLSSVCIYGNCFKISRLKWNSNIPFKLFLFFPDLAKSKQVSSPMPVFPPVMTTIRPSSRFGLSVPEKGHLVHLQLFKLVRFRYSNRYYHWNILVKLGMCMSTKYIST